MILASFRSLIKCDIWFDLGGRKKEETFDSGSGACHASAKISLQFSQDMLQPPSRPKSESMRGDHPSGRVADFGSTKSRP